ncbi:hypothetical protein FCM35_KLT12316 [Carex littledalei]|uniref:Uncharacterized protein n=1 Tax=Carex littledalei TaxID=544730 RepID=A0A833QG17_9POAL|nr:hypothetical protein FCM35_KLT12316 [Carex littledalei]
MKRRYKFHDPSSDAVHEVPSSSRAPYQVRRILPTSSLGITSSAQNLIGNRMVIPDTYSYDFPNNPSLAPSLSTLNAADSRAHAKGCKLCFQSLLDLSSPNRTQMPQIPSPDSLDESVLKAAFG